MADRMVTISDMECNCDRTIVLVGRTGNGKSATGNSILGRRAFKSKSGFRGVTTTTELQSGKLDNRVINVIDTPGLFDASATPEFISKEILKCIQLAKDGIHAIVLVFSARARFSREEEAVLPSLQSIFGPKITDYMILAFTGGDQLEEDDESIEGYLSECPDSLKKIVNLCKNRYVLFDNRTKDIDNKKRKVQQLLDLVDKVVEENKGQPYTNEMFKQVKEGEIIRQNQQHDIDSLREQGVSKKEIAELKDLMRRSYEDQLKQITETVETKLRETTLKLQQQLAEEQAARLKAELMAKASQQNSQHEINKLREDLLQANREVERLRLQPTGGGGGRGCAIL